mgnify:FL=1|jgi:hypothetical protein
MKKTNFKAIYNSKTKKYDIIRFDNVYCFFTEQELTKKGFIIKNNILYEGTEIK